MDNYKNRNIPSTFFPVFLIFIYIKNVQYINILKFIFFFLLSIFLLRTQKKLREENIELNENYLKAQSYSNLYFKNKLNNKINFGIYCHYLTNGGIARITSLLLHYLSKIKIFNLFLFSLNNKENNEYLLPQTIKRIIIKKGRIKNLIKQIKKAKIDILIYNYYIKQEINILSSLKKIKVIFYNHSCFLFWLYNNSPIAKTLYESYINCKYVISLVPFENDYLFQIWGIRSILMNNFITYEYENIFPSDLSSKTILMIGRAKDKLKRFELGIKAMYEIIKKIPICQLKIISNLDGIKDLKNLVNELKLENNVEFIGFTLAPEIYFKNSSLHIFPSISESFGLVLCETKIYGIPNILIGLDYIYISKGGTVIIISRLIYFRKKYYFFR